MDNESGHWYRRNGSPCYEVPTADGKRMRGINLRWDRKLRLVPSVTTVLDVLAKPALVNWKVNQGILAALTLPRKESWTEEDYVRFIKEDGQRQAKEAAERGTYIHDQLERDRKGKSVDDWCKPTCERVRELLSDAFPGVTDWVAEKSFAHESGYGGKVDLHSPSTGIIVDYKTKDGDFTDGKRLAYDQHYQLAAYQQGLGFPVTACANIFASRDTQGAAQIHAWSEKEVSKGRDMFNAALAVWKLLKNYDPSFSNTTRLSDLPHRSRSQRSA